MYAISNMDFSIEANSNPGPELQNRKLLRMLAILSPSDYVRSDEKYKLIISKYSVWWYFIYSVQGHV